MTERIKGLQEIRNEIRAECKEVFDNAYNEALEKGADYLVIGRPITQAEEPERAAEKIVRELGV